MDDETLETKIETEITKPNNAAAMIVTIVICLAAALSGLIFYNIGYTEGEKKYKDRDPKLNILLTTLDGPTTAIPVTLTKNGIGIKFNTPITNLSAIGISEADKRD